MRCPTCGAPVMVRKDSWECGYCCDCGNLPRPRIVLTVDVEEEPKLTIESLAENADPDTALLLRKFSKTLGAWDVEELSAMGAVEILERAYGEDHREGIVMWSALLYAMIGAVLGTGLSFLLAKLLGRDFLHIFFGEEKMSYYIERLNSKQAYAIVFFLYLIPGIPKDMVSYAAGASEMRFKPFILLSAVGRLPGMVGCLLIGSMVESGNYVGVGVLLAIAVIACILCIVFRKRINVFLDKIYNKISK